MKSPRPRIIVPYALAAVSALLFFWTRPSLQSSKLSPAQEFDILRTAVRHIRNDYVDEAHPDRTMEGAFQGLVGSLDPMSAYLNTGLMAKATAARIDRLYDVGLAAYKRTGIFPVVVGVAEDSPAEQAGIKPGDTVTAVDDRSTLVWSYNEFRFALKEAGPKPVKLRLIQKNATVEKTLERALPYSDPVAWSAENGTAGVVRFAHLFSGTAAAFETAVLPKITDRTKPLILDLRGCREGENGEARALINLFLKNPRAGTFDRKGGVKAVFSCPAEPVLPDIPLVVWTDPATMGPSEIFAAVLRDLKRAKIVGTQTAGLAAEQKLFPLETGDGLLLTTGEFVLASGGKVFGKGVTPDLKIDSDKTSRRDYLEQSKGFFRGL
ncbi:MAG: PDZ domain-containing protein [Candidatus Aminicenantes bacterium]|nr:PDZ domain-containing protein [Candidatus Aminicenantes bacterium]